MAAAHAVAQAPAFPIGQAGVAWGAAEKAEVYKGDPVDTFDPIQVVRLEEAREKEGHVSVRMLYTAVQASCQHGHERGRGERQGIHGPLMVGGDWAAVYLPKAGKMN